MGVCCSKNHPETIQVKETKEVATSTSSLKEKSVQDVQIGKEWKSSETSLPSVDTKIVRDDEELFDTAAAQTRYSTFKHDREHDPVRRVSVYVEGRRISQDDDLVLKNTLTGLGRKSEEGTTETDDVPKGIVLSEDTKALLDLEECLKGFDADDSGKEASSTDILVLEKEITRTEEEGRRFLVTGSNDKEDAEEESESSSDDGECLEESDLEINDFPAERTSSSLEKIDEGDAEQESESSSGDGECLEESDLKINDFPAERTSSSLEKIDEVDEEVETTSLSKDESETESFLDVKGEMLSLFNRLEADASFIHSVTGKEEDIKSTKSEEQSSNGDSSMVREMEAAFQELKHQYELNTPDPGSDETSEADSFFDLSKEMENIISKFEQVQINSEESTSMESNPDSPESGSTLGELVTRFQNLVLHSDDSGSDETEEGGQDVISKEGSYFNMQEEIDFRLNVIRRENVI